MPANLPCRWWINPWASTVLLKYNYYPGWHQPFTSSHLVVNLEIWNTLAKSDQALLEAGCTAAVTRNLAQAEALQGEVIAGFPEIGVSAERLPNRC